MHQMLDGPTHPGEAPRLKLGQILLSMSLAAGHYRIPIMGYDIINPYNDNGELTSDCIQPKQPFLGPFL